MTVTELRVLVETDLSNEALSVVLGAAAELVEERLGPIGPVTEVRNPSGPLIGLSRRAVEVLSVTERGEEVDAEDYALRPSGRIVERIRGRWRGKVAVRYQPMPDAARRASVTADLVRTHLEFHPGLTAARFGSWAESYASNPDYRASRDAILAMLDEDEGVLH